MSLTAHFFVVFFILRQPRLYVASLLRVVEHEDSFRNKKRTVRVVLYDVQEEEKV